MIPQFFKNQSEFRKWLSRNHKKETELLVGFYKVGTGKPSLKWSQSVDQAICFGWIDGIRKSIDKDSYSIRFTPRKPNSIWSDINIKKVEALTRAGLMKPAGAASFKLWNESRSKIYSYERKRVKLSPPFEKKIKANKKAWRFFQSLAPSYRKQSINWVMSAKQEVTRIKRLTELTEESERGEKIKPLRR